MKMLHQLQISGPNKQLLEILEKYFDEEGAPYAGEKVISFNKIVPEPEDFRGSFLDDVYCPTEYIAQAYIAGTLFPEVLVDWFGLSPEECPGKVSLQQISQLVAEKYPDSWKQFSDGLYNYKAFGFTNLGEWRLKNWGVQSPASSGQIEEFPDDNEESGQLVCSFKTNETFPESALSELSGKYPDCSFLIYSLVEEDDYHTTYLSETRIANGLVFDAFEYTENQEIAEVLQRVFGKGNSQPGATRGLASLIFES